jgi:hypothetical protein
VAAPAPIQPQDEKCMHLHGVIDVRHRRAKFKLRR